MAEEGLVGEEALEGEGCRLLVVVAVEGVGECHLEHLRAGEEEVVVARSKMEVVEEARAGRSMTAMEVVVARLPLAKVVEVEPRKPVLGAQVERWTLVTGEAQRFSTAGSGAQLAVGLGAHSGAHSEAHLGADLEVAAKTGAAKEERFPQASWEAMVAADQKAGRLFLVPEEEGGQGHG